MNERSSADSFVSQRVTVFFPIEPPGGKAVVCGDSFGTAARFPLFLEISPEEQMTREPNDYMHI